MQQGPSNPPAFQAIPDVMQDGLVGRYGRIYRAEGIRSLLVVPLQLTRSRCRRGRTLETITFYWRDAARALRPGHLYASARLANLSSAALNISELHEQNQREKARLKFLAEASAVLVSSLDYEDTLQRVAQLAGVQHRGLVHGACSGVMERRRD